MCLLPFLELEKYDETLGGYLRSNDRWDDATMRKEKMKMKMKIHVRLIRFLKVNSKIES